MDKDHLISFCIPTRNNMKYLKDCLESLVPQVKSHQVPIYVSDNASTDHTIKMLSSFKKDVYPLVYYRSNERDLGFDQNLINAVAMASSEYVWPLGDRRRLMPGSFERVYKLLSDERPSLLLFGVDLEKYSLQIEQYHSAREVFLKLWPNAGTMSFFVVPRKIWANDTLKKYVGTGWVHFAAVFEYLAKMKNVDVRLAGWPSIASSGKSGWTRDFFNVWASWKKVINDLPDIYSAKDKETVIKAWTINRSISILIYLRAVGAYNKEIYDRHEQDFLKYTSFSLIEARLVAELPSFFLKPYPMLRDVISKGSRLLTRSRHIS